MIPAANNPWKGLAALIPNTITVYPTKQAYEGTGGVGTGAPVDNTKPYKPWRDNSAWYPGSSWWGGGMATREYNTFATNNQEQLLLQPIDSPGFYYTYSDAVIRTYREWRHLFPAGVPVLVQLVMSGGEASQFNYGSNGEYTPPPAVINSNIMLAQQTPNGEWMAIDYQEWVKIQKAATQIPAELKVEMIRGVCGKAISAEAKLSEIRILAQVNNQTGGVI